MELSISINKVIITVVGAVGVSILAGEEPVIEERFDPDRTTLSLSFKKKMAKKVAKKVAKKR